MTNIPRAQDQLFDPRQSARQKYAALVVGRDGWGALLRHEAIRTTGGTLAIGSNFSFELGNILFGAFGSRSVISRSHGLADMPSIVSLRGFVRPTQ